MGDMFDPGGPSSNFTGTRAQHALFQPLSSLFLSSISQAGPAFAATQAQLADLQTQLGRDTTDEAKALSERIFMESLLDPALRSFEDDIRPGIESSFAGIGGSLSSRRGATLSDALTDVHLGAQAALASQLPEIHAFPLQQTLGQIAGLTQIQQGQLAPIQQALSFALAPTQAISQQPGGFGASLFGDLLGAGTTLGAAQKLA